MYIVANQLEYSNGTKRDRGELLLDAEQLLPPSTIQKKGSLYLILEPDNFTFPLAPAELELAQSVQQIIVQDYYNYSGSTVTSALRAAIEKANQFIFSRNSKLLPPERRGFGMSCAVLRGQEIYLAQLPPTQAILVHQNQLKYFPTPSDRVPGPRAVAANSNPQITQPLPSGTSNPRRVAQPSLGRYNTIEPNLIRNIFEEGDVLIFVSTELLRALRNEQTERIFMKQDGRTALYSLSDWMRNEQIQNGYSLAISALSEYALNKQNISSSRATGSHPAVKSGSSNPRNMVTSAGDYEYDDGGDDDVVVPVQPRSDAHSPASTVNRNVTDPLQHDTADTPGKFDPVAPFDHTEKGPWIRREQDLLQQPPFLRDRNPNATQPLSVKPDNKASGNAPTAPFKVPVNSSAAPPQMPEINPNATRPFTVNKQFTSQSDISVQPPSNPPADIPENPSFETREASPGPTNLEYEAVPSPPYFDEANRYGTATSFEKVARPSRFSFLRDLKLPLFLRSTRNLLILGGVVVLLIAAFVLYGIFSKSNQQQTIAANYVQQAEASRETADQMALADPIQARAIIEQARINLDKAKAEQPNNPKIAPEQASLQQTLDKINKVFVPPDLRLTYDATSLGAGVKLAQTVLSDDGTTLFLLDKGRNSVYSLDANGTGQPKTILKPGDSAGGHDFAKAVGMSVHPSGIVLVDDKNVAWVYNRTADTWTTSVLGGSTAWTKPVQQVATYNGNLYIVGPGNGQILRYLTGNYTGNPEAWLDPGVLDQVNVERASVFAIDGQVYSLGPDGNLMTLARKTGQNKGQISQQAQLSGNILSPPLNSPLALNPVNFDYPYFFVVDNEKRVVQFKKDDGSLVQQFRAATGNTEFDKARDVAVDPKANKIYVVGEQKIYSFSFSQPASNAVTVATVGFNGATPSPTN